MFTGNSYEKTSATADKNNNPRDKPEGIMYLTPTNEYNVNFWFLFCISILLIVKIILPRECRGNIKVAIFYHYINYSGDDSSSC